MRLCRAAFCGLLVIKVIFVQSAGYKLTQLRLD